MLERQPIPYLIASSVTAELAPPSRFGLKETIEVATGISDGTQLYINPSSFSESFPDHEDASQLKDMLAQAGLLTNVVHLPGYITPKELSEDVKDSMRIASQILTPKSTEVGKLLVIHHKPMSGISNDEIVRSTMAALENLHDPDIGFGFENFYPFKSTNQENLGDQVDQYVELLNQLQDETPTFAVLDVARLFASPSSNINEPPAPLNDPEYKFLEKMCRAVEGQFILVHGTDKYDTYESFSTPGNAAPLGTGAFTPAYRKMAELTQKYNIRILGVVDETESLSAISSTENIQRLFSRQ